jgi:Ni/Co efflux regulator RcnB
MRFEMKFRLVTTALAAAMGAGLMAYADPPHSTRGDQPPGLAKQGKIPPGHARKMWKKGEYLLVDYRTGHHFEDWRRYDLEPAPPGYRWVVVDQDAYLMEVTTGLVANAIIDLLD